MKILLLHSEDNPEQGPWAAMPWDRVIDLGLGGVNSYEDWRRQFRCPVTALNLLRQGFSDFRRVRDVLGLGCGRVIDQHGLDWWEILSILLHEEVETLLLLRRFAETVASDDEVHVSRPGLHAGLLQCFLPDRTKVFTLRRAARKGGLASYVRAVNRLSATQMIDVFWDKYDAGYQFRGRFARKRTRSPQPVVLLPTAYVNVSRTGIAYSKTFPEESFLLVATRKSGWLNDLPPNVESAALSSYATERGRSGEYEDLENRFRALLNDLVAVPEFEILNRLGYLDSFPQRFRHGLEVRDAWRNVLETEPVQAVLCADDSNPYTRIPLLLARERGLTNIACHHGALDGRYVFKRSYADLIWAKGEMEEDYLVRKCGVPRERVEIGAPAVPVSSSEAEKRDVFRPNLIFFSELYEASGGRLVGLYRDILPPLADVALATGRRLVVKLHPAESERERTSMLARILSADQLRAASVVTGPLTEDLLAKTWCGVTILSTVAAECAVRGIPCFLCQWLEGLPYGYVEQFIRFGVGIGLDNPDEIKKIPELLRDYRVRPEVRENCSHSVAPGRLRQLLASSQEPSTAAVS
jgi:hypothetical protein